MHIPNPSVLVGPLHRTYAYFRPSVTVEGDAWLCDSPHGPFVAFDSDVVAVPRAQHIDVSLRFWNRRSDPVTVIDVLEIDLPQRNTVKLAVAAWDPFEPIVPEAGGAPQTRDFALVPRDAPDALVEAATGDVLELEFRPSRGSERWARPRIQLILRVRP